MRESKPNGSATEPRTPGPIHEPGRDGRGRLKIFLGYAPGVGKTFSMLDEAHRRKRRGQDVVVGIISDPGREDTQKHVEGLDSVAPRRIEAGGRTLEELDTEAIIARRPGVVLIDEIEHVNPPGADREKRWQDVEAILDAGIGVLTTLGVQHLESLNDHVADITGIRIENTVPDHILHEADEVELVDVTPRALLNRLERGDVVEQDLVQEARHGLFREGNLNALREIALREIAGRVDEDVSSYRKQKRIEKPWAATDRVMICVSPTKSSLRLLRRGWRMSQRMHGDVLAVYVEDEAPSAKEQKILKDDFSLAERLEIPVVTLKGDPAEQIIKYARENNVTQIVIGHSTRSRVQELLKPSILSELARELRTIDILVVATEAPSGGA